ncbi:sensor histidine kinase [Spirosoma soli]|uniref:histidine kinase n=1 Tax=Spirosoma soli TaxID=1770529 RepID=A0ABW5MD02_9BACT
MTIRNRLALRFTGLVSAILLLAFVSIYAFCWYFIASDFYRRLDRKAYTYGEMLIHHRLDADLIRQLSRIRRDQLPHQKILIFDHRDSVVFANNRAEPFVVPPDLLASVRQQQRKELRKDAYYILGIQLVADGPPGRAGQFVVLAAAENVYGDTFLRNLRWALTALFTLIAGITAFSGWVYAGDALRPMQRIDEQLSHIFPRNRDERLPVRAENDEISRLSTTINRLLDRVAESFRLQRMFVANVSHELKNPLTQISSQLEVSLLNQRDPAAYRQTIRSVLDDVSDLATLTRELLQLSQVNQDNVAGLLTDVVRLDEMVWDIREEVQALNPRYNVTVDLGVLPDEPDQLTVMGNKTLLCTALKNLTENACKFAPDGQAQIALEFSVASVCITIQNEGRPIPAEDLPYIFEPFYRSRQTADQVKGYGVGLSLVERIIRLHGGKISVQSQAGEPTVFQILLLRSDNLAGAAL